MTPETILLHLATLTITPADYFRDLSNDGLFDLTIKLRREARSSGLAGDERNARRLVLASCTAEALLAIRERRTLHEDHLPDLVRRLKSFYGFEQTPERMRSPLEIIKASELLEDE